MAGTEEGKGLGKEGKRALAIRAPIGLILWSLVAAKFSVVNQTIGEEGCHSMLLLGDWHGHVSESLSPPSAREFTLKPGR